MAESIFEVRLPDGEIRITGSGTFVSECAQALSSILQSRQAQAFAKDGGKLVFEALTDAGPNPATNPANQ